MKRKKTWLYVCLTLLMLALTPAAVYGEEPDGDTADKTLAPYFFVQDAAQAADQFPLKDTSVSSTINGVIAETYVTQTYANEGTIPINASYVFPASARVTVHGMKMEIGNEVITAKIKEREEAKTEFEEAKSEGKSASLLEQQRPNVFTMNVANVMPGDTVRIELHYTELISPRDGVYQFVFPTVTGPRYAGSAPETGGGDEWTASPYLEEGTAPQGTYEIAVSLSAGVPISSLTSSSHKIKVEKESESIAHVTLSDSGEFAGDRDFILDYRLTGQEINCGLMLDTGEKENFFMLMVQPPERVRAEEIPPREYIFVLDVSGSMFGYPLDTAKELIGNLVGNLRDSDQFNLILFSDTAVSMAPKSVPATAENIRQAIDLIERQDGGGGTELAPALEQAVSLPRDPRMARSIVTITDGYMSDESSIFSLINRNLKTADFFSFGIGTSVNRYLIDGIAKAGSGEAFVVTEPSQASDTARDFSTYIQSPVMTGIKVSFDGFDVYDVEPDILPTLFAQRPIVLFGKWRGQPSGTIRITGKTGNQDYMQEIPVGRAEAPADNTAIPYLWARTKVERLTDYGTREDVQDAVRQAMIKKTVTQLGLDYSMMTPYTSFIAVTETVRSQDGSAADVKQPLPLPQHVSNFAVGAGYTIGSEPGTLILMCAAGVIMAAGCIRRSRADRKKRKTEEA